MEEEAIRRKIIDARNLIGEGNLIDAIELFTKSRDATLRNNEILNISSRFHLYEEKKRQEILSNEEANLELNKISIAFLKCLDDLEAPLKKPKMELGKESDYRSYLVKGAMLITGLLLLIYLGRTFLAKEVPSIKELNSIFYQLKDNNVTRMEKQKLIGFVATNYFEPDSKVEIQMDHVLVEEGLTIPTYLKQVILGHYNDCLIKDVNRHQLIINCPNQ